MLIDEDTIHAIYMISVTTQPTTLSSKPTVRHTPGHEACGILIHDPLLPADPPEVVQLQNLLVDPEFDADLYLATHDPASHARITAFRTHGSRAFEPSGLSLRDPASAFVLSSEEMADALLSRFPDLLDRPPWLSPEIMVWHTHPGGGVGPSAGDLATRLPGTRNLVVSLPSPGAALGLGNPKPVACQY